MGLECIIGRPSNPIGLRSSKLLMAIDRPIDTVVVAVVISAAAITAAVGERW